MSESDLNCLTLLSFNQPIGLNDFCYDASSEESWIFKSPQTVRNSINKAEKNSLVIKNKNSVRDVQYHNIQADVKFDKAKSEKPAQNHGGFARPKPGHWDFLLRL